MEMHLITKHILFILHNGCAKHYNIVMYYSGCSISNYFLKHTAMGKQHYSSILLIYTEIQVYYDMVSAYCPLYKRWKIITRKVKVTVLDEVYSFSVLVLAGMGFIFSTDWGSVLDLCRKQC